MAESVIQSVLLLIRSIVQFILQLCIAYLYSIYRYFSPRRKSVKDQVVIITGAGHGLGYETANLLAVEGAKLALLDINKDAVTQVAAQLTAKGHYARAYGGCDVSNYRQITDVLKQIEQDIGPTDILINNAGFVNCRPLLNIAPEQIRRTFEVNTLSHFWTIQAVLQGMQKRRKGHIVAIASISGLIGTANIVDYGASKAAVIGLMEALKRELRPEYSEIALTTICPLAMNTGMFHKPKSRFSSFLPILSPETVAREVVRAIQREDALVVVPRWVRWIHIIGELLPDGVRHLAQDFLNYGVDSNGSIKVH